MATKGTKSPRKSARSKAPAKKAATGGVDLAAIEKELNSDADAQGAFQKNPAKFLEERGLRLRAKDKTELKTLVREMSSGPKIAEGSASDDRPRGGIRIVIKRWIR